jgi:hypothetical protein
MAYSQILSAAIETQVYDVLHSLLLKIASDYDLDHGVLVERYLISGREGSPPPQYIYKSTGGDIPDAPVKGPRKAKVQVSTKDSDSEEEVAPKRKTKAKRKSDADDREGKCTSLTAKGALCKNNAFGGGCTCRVHMPKEGKASKEKEKKKAKGGKAKKVEPEHSHKMDELAASDCELCETHGNPLEGEQEFEVEDVKEVLAALRAEDSDSEEMEAPVDRDEDEMSEEELQALADELEDAVGSGSEYSPESEEDLD